MSKKSAAAADTPQQAVQVYMKEGETKANALARTYMEPALNAAATMQNAMKRDFGEMDLVGIATELRNQCSAVSNGKMERPEAMLTTQAHTLDAMFNGLTRLAYQNVFTHFDSAERLFRLALKAQTQSRATWETLAATRNPPVVFARQANVATGPQQINNNFESSTHARTRETQSEQNRLLEQTDGQRLDSGATGQAIGSDSAMATVGAFDRTEDGGR